MFEINSAASYVVAHIISGKICWTGSKNLKEEAQHQRHSLR